MIATEVMPADSRPAVFVSFSGRNAARKELVGRLLARLSEQPLRPWIYESAEEEIAPGQDIALECLARVSAAQLVIVIVSEEAFGSSVTALEVDLAMKLHGKGQLQLLCVKQVEIPHKDWPSPFSALTRFKHGSLTKLEEIEAVVMSACSLAKVDYLPVPDHPPLFPLAHRVQEELKIASATDKGRATGSFKEAIRLARECEAAYENGHLMTASMAVEKLVSLCEREFRPDDIYYPRIAAGVIAFELGRGERGSLDRAETHFQCAKQRPHADEDASQGLGMIAMKRGDAMGAFTHFMDASRLVRSGPDLHLEHNIVLAALIAGGDACREAVRIRRGALAKGMTSTMPGAADRLKFLYLLASVSLGQTDPSEIRRVLEEVRTIPEDISLHYIDSLSGWESDGPNHTIRLALEIAEQLFAVAQTLADSARPSTDYMRKLTHRVAWLNFDAGRLDRARDLFRSLVDQYPHGARHLADLFVFSRFASNEADSTRAAASLLKMTSCDDSQPGISQREFDFLVGMVQWDEHDLGAARESFRRSRRTGGWYDESFAWLPPKDRQ